MFSRPLFRLQQNPGAVLVALFALLVIFSVSRLPGFLPQHAGYAGPHLFSVARNLWVTPDFLLADQRTTSGWLHAYNHHPPLFFWLQSLLTAVGPSYSARLQLAYLFSASFTGAGLAIMYLALRRLGFTSLTAGIATIAMLGTRMLATYRGFTTFDAATLPLAALLLYTFIGVQQNPSRQNWWHLRLAAVLALLTSWYVTPVLLVAFSWRILTTYRTRGLRAALSSPAAISGYLTGALTGLLLAVLMAQEIHVTGNLASLNHSFGENLGAGVVSGVPVTRAVSLPRLFYMLLRRLLETLPLALLPALLLLPFAYHGSLSTRWQTLRLQLRLLRQKHHLALTAARPIALGAALFILATAYWSIVHPFAYLWLLPPLGVVVAILLQRLEGRRSYLVVTTLLLFGALANLTLATFLDTREATATAPLLQLVDTHFARGVAYRVVGGIHADCGLFNEGQYRYLASAPNLWLDDTATTPPAGWRVIVLRCLNPTTSTLEITEPATSQRWQVSAGDPGNAPPPALPLQPAP